VFPLKAGWTPEWCRLGDEEEFSAHVKTAKSSHSFKVLSYAGSAKQKVKIRLSWLTSLKCVRGVEE
jgi:hypothetical protein